jgi:phosphate/sulfate permease
MEERGLIAALVALIVIARFAGREGSLAELAVMVVVLIAVAVGIFVYGLNIYLRLWI